MMSQQLLLLEALVSLVVVFLTLLGSKVRRAMSFVGIDDGLEALKHLPQRKKKDQGSDHYFRKGVTRQQEMSLVGEIKI
jgi:hypothetical protein